MLTFTPKTEANKQDDLVLKKVSYIYYSILFKKDKIKALFDFSSKINAMSLGYALKLVLKICHTSIKAQKIDGSIFKIFGIVLASFQVENKIEKAYFF